MRQTMAQRLETVEALNLKNEELQSRGYLYFNTRPPQVWLADDNLEQHDEILDASGRKFKEISIAGRFTIHLGDVMINGAGSQTLEFPPKDATPVYKFVLQLSGVDPNTIDLSEN